MPANKFVLKDAFFEVDGVELSEFVSDLSIETTRDEVDVTGMGAANKETMAGIGDATISVTFFQSFAATAVDDTLWPLSTSDDPFPVKIRAENEAASVTNPTYEMQCLMYGYSPISGSIGDAASTEVTFKNADQAGLTRTETGT